MIALPLDELRRLCKGELRVAPGALHVTGVEIDSRRIRPGDLFVAVGVGAAYCGEALTRGASATLVPDDAHAALAALGTWVRHRTRARVVGITGSVGKTSTKDILAALCRPHARTIAAEASYNAELGVPLTLCRLEDDTEVCVAELAMRGLGQIAALCAIARPEIGVVTSVGPAHLELVGTLANVARAKAELLDALPAGAVAVVPESARELRPFLRADLDVRRFGPGGDYRLVSAHAVDGGTHATFDLAGQRVELRLNLTARHHVENALAALCVYQALNLPLDRAQLGADRIELSRWRGDETPLPGGGLLINDAYNANPVSMRAALRHLAERAGSRRRVAVLGEMAELGPDSAAFHEEIGRAAADAGVDVLVAVGAAARAYLDGADGLLALHAVETVEEAIALLEGLIQPGDVVLVKASRAVGLETVAEALASVAA